MGIAPILIPDKAYDPGSLPRVETVDLLLFLVLETSYYSKDQFKAYRSLQAHNQSVCELREREQNRKQHCFPKIQAFTENELSVCYIVDYNRRKWHCSLRALRWMYGRT